MSLILLQNITKRFGGEDILHDISFRVEESDKVGLIGRNGTGKSTLFRLIMGELTPRSIVFYLADKCGLGAKGSRADNCVGSGTAGNNRGLAHTPIQMISARVIDQLAGRLQSGDYPIAVQGHTDDKPIHTNQFPSNWELSAARAAAVVQQLIAQGVAPNRLSAVGLANTQPIASNDTAQGRAENRRVDLVLQLPPELLTGAKP